MTRVIRNPIPIPKRIARYRQRMREAGLRPVQIWVPDTRSPDFVEACRRQARAVATHDPADDKIMQFISRVTEWPKP